MDKKYRVVFLDLVESREDFEKSLSTLGVTAATVAQILEKAPVILKAGMSLGQARQYAEVVQEAGGRVNIQEDGIFERPRQMNKAVGIEPFENFTMCPECGFKQRKIESCIKCGFSLKAEEA